MKTLVKGSPGRSTGGGTDFTSRPPEESASHQDRVRRETRGDSGCGGDMVRRGGETGGDKEHTNKKENHNMVHVKLCEKYEFDKILKNLVDMPYALINVRGLSRMSLVTPGHALGV